MVGGSRIEGDLRWRAVVVTHPFQWVTLVRCGKVIKVPVKGVIEGSGSGSVVYQLLTVSLAPPEQYRYLGELFLLRHPDFS